MNPLRLLGVNLLVALASLAQAQLSPESIGSGGDRGFTFTTSASGNHDSASGWASILDSSVRYDFSRVFGMELGVPYYMSHTGFDTSRVVGLNQSMPLVTSYNSLGDMYLTLHLAAPDTWFSYSSTITGTAPTGDTSTAISTGRATFDFNNHFEHGLTLFTPYIEIGIGNTSTLVNRGGRLLKITRPYTTLGPLSHYKAGGTFDFLKIFSFDACGYEDLPIGDQKVYARTTKLKTLKNGRTVQGKRTVSTGQGIVEDNGLSGGLTLNLGQHLALTGGYQRSLRQSLDIVAFGVSYTFGHKTNKPVAK
jgi:hypothetical protein